MKSMFRLSFFVVLFALLSIGAEAQTPCVEGTHYRVNYITNNGVRQAVVTFSNTSNCVWVKPKGVTSIEYVLVGGGGAGGSSGTSSGSLYGCGGGGAGQFITNQSSLLTDTMHFRVKVGAGGTATVINSGGNGSSTTLHRTASNGALALAALGGGGGGNFYDEGKSGASSGGGGGRAGKGSEPVSIANVSGNLGGNAVNSGTSNTAAGGGGGGFSQEGDDALITGGNRYGGNGGAGIASSITGTSVYYAGGGGGGSSSNGSLYQGQGGLGGGGNGSYDGNAQSGLDGTGGGGGGANGPSDLGGDGGDGVVVIRYNVPPCIENTDFISEFAFSGGKPYRVLKFQDPQSLGCIWTKPTGVSNLDYLVVAGGGSGGSVLNDWHGAGGGGAGGLLTGTINTTLSSFLIKIGEGGVAPSSTGSGVNGSNSILEDYDGNTVSLIAIGGGGGGEFKVSGKTGGSGGGGGGRVSQAGGSATTGQGYQGGNARNNDDVGRVAGGGGGGAGAVGGNGGINTTIAGNGGAGVSNSITGIATFYAGGGGGGAWDTESSGEVRGTGGNGGGGAGSLSGNATSGTNGLGGGGGGAGYNGLGGNGGRGTVIIRYNDEISLSPTTTAGAGIVKESTGLFITEGLTVDANKTLVIEPNVRLIVEGDIVNDGTILIKASADTVSYGQLKWTGTYSGSGTVQVEKYLTNGWNMLAAGMQNPTTAYFGSVATNTNQNLANLYTWGGTEFVKTFSGDAISNSKGYLAYVGADGVKSSAGVYTFSGSPINEMTPEALHDDTKKANESTVTMYGGSGQSRFGWNLLPNPFLSDLRIGNLNRANINATYYIRTTKGGYRAVAPAGIEPDKVPPLSAYWVQANGANPTIQNGNSGKVTLPALGSAEFAPSTVGSARLMRDPTELDQRVWNKAFVQVTGEVTGRGERHSIVEKGFVYSLSPNPEVGGVGTLKIVASAPGLGIFQLTIPDLNVNSVYYVRPYATSPSGTSYGTQITVTTPSSFTCDGSSVSFSYNGSTVSYNTIYNGSTKECWLDRNLGATAAATTLKGCCSSWFSTGGITTADDSHYFQWGRKADGHQISNSVVSSTQISTSISSSNFINNNNWTNSTVAGLWNGMDGANNPCPSGWKVPNAGEWSLELNSWNKRNLDPRNMASGNLYVGSFSSSGASIPDPNSSILKLRMSSVRRPAGVLEGRADDDDAVYPRASIYWTSQTSGGTTNANIYGVLISESWLGKSNTDFGQLILTRMGNGAFVRCIRSDGYVTSSQSID